MNYKNTEFLHAFTQISPMWYLNIITVHYQNQETDIGVMLLTKLQTLLGFH